MDLFVLGLPMYFFIYPKFFERAGKTSLTKVVFQKLPLHEVHSLSSTTTVETISIFICLIKKM